jgi:hypothetical protein
MVSDDTPKERPNDALDGTVLETWGISELAHLLCIAPRSADQGCIFATTLGCG